MKQFVGITASDGLNRKRHYFSFSVLETMYHENWSNIFPVGLNHDRTKTIGAGRLDGIYFEPGKAYVTNRTYIAENITDRQKFKSEFDLWVYRQYIEPRKEELKELEGMLEGLLSTEKTVAPIAAVAFKDKGIVLRVFPKLKDLIDDDGLINLSNLAPILPGVYKKDGFLLFASSYLRRNCYIGNSLNSEFLNCLQALRNENDSLSVKIRLDFDLVGLYGTQQQELEYSYWWGPKFTEDIEDIDLGVTRHSNDNYDNFFSNLVFTEFGWYYQDGNKTLEIEEVIDSINIISEEQELIGCRYIHSYINPETSQPKHLDGAIRAYTEDKILMRMDTSLDKTERDTVYTKLWRIDGDIPVARWKEIITHYYRDNILIGEYFHGVDKTLIEMQATSEVVPYSKAIDFESFIPVNLNTNNGLRVFFSYGNPIHFNQYDVDVKSTRYVYFNNGEKQKVMDNETITLLKLIQRNGLSVRFPNVKCIAHEDTVTNFPIFECRDDNVFNRVISTVRQLFEALADTYSNRLIAISFATNINENESITISFAGHIMDYIKLINGLETPFSSAAYMKWINRIYSLNSSFFIKSNFEPSPFSIISGKELRFNRQLVPSEYISGFEMEENHLKANLILPTKILQGIHKNGISIAPCFLINNSICSRCKNDYRLCNCIKFVDDGITEAPTIEKMLYCFWTNRHS